jgi:fluoride exporter
VDPWIRVILLSAGGALGTNARYWLGVWMSRWVSPDFPWATFTINVSGSFAIGFLTMALARWLPHPYIRLLVLIGFLGGYTTFSTFEFDALTLWDRGETRQSFYYTAGSVASGFAAVALGVSLARHIIIPIAEHATGIIPQFLARAESQGPFMPLVEPDLGDEDRP